MTKNANIVSDRTKKMKYSFCSEVYEVNVSPVDIVKKPLIINTVKLDRNPSPF